MSIDNKLWNNYAKPTLYVAGAVIVGSIFSGCKEEPKPPAPITEEIAKYKNINSNKLLDKTDSLYNLIMYDKYQSSRARVNQIEEVVTINNSLQKRALNRELIGLNDSSLNVLKKNALYAQGYEENIPLEKMISDVTDNTVWKFLSYDQNEKELYQFNVNFGEWSEKQYLRTRNIEVDIFKLDTRKKQYVYVKTKELSYNQEQEITIGQLLTLD